MVSRYLLGRSAGNAYYREFFTVSGNWVCPPGVAKVSVLIMSSGLKGATATGYEFINGNGPGAGGAGGFYYHIKEYTVVPGQSYSVIVGAACTSTTVRNTSDFNNLVTSNNMSVFTSYNTTGGTSGKGGQENNAGVSGIKANALFISPIIKNNSGELISTKLEYATVDTICYGGAGGNRSYGMWGSGTSVSNGGNGITHSIIDLSVNSNAGYGCGGKGGESYQWRYEYGSWARELREGQNGGQGLVTLFYLK